MNGNVALVSILLSISACALSPDEEPGDAEHERFVAEGGGKEDTGGIAEGTAQARGVLHVANTLTPTSTTCGAWSAVDLGTISWRTKADGQLKLAKYGDTIMLQTVHGLCNQAGAYENDDYELPNGLAFALEGKLTENCAQMHDTRATIWGNEYEVALLVRY